MENTFWHKQTLDKPLFPQVLWSRPEVKARAGKLLIIGGNRHGFTAPATAYDMAQKAGIGSMRVLLPDALQRTLSSSFAEAEFGSSTPSGSFARQALALALEMAKWADGVLLAGDFGRNSETAILLDSFISNFKGLVTLAGDSLDYFLNTDAMTSRRQSVIVVDIARLQKLAKNSRLTKPILHSMNLQELVTILADWTNSIPASFITEHADHYIVASGGKVSITPTKTELNWQVELSAYAATWLIQQPKKPFEALTTAAFCAVS